MPTTPLCHLHLFPDFYKTSYRLGSHPCTYRTVASSQTGPSINLQLEMRAKARKRCNGEVRGGGTREGIGSHLGPVLFLSALCLPLLTSLAPTFVWALLPRPSQPSLCWGALKGLGIWPQLQHLVLCLAQ